VRRFFLAGLGVVFLIVGCVWGYIYSRPALVPLGESFETEERVLDKYSFSELRKRRGVGSEFEFLGRPEMVDQRRSSKSFDSQVLIYKSEGKKISGIINWPAEFDENKKYPVVMMVRGYAEKEGYYPGFGSFRVADELAKEGYLTVSTDFLGYGESDEESEDMLEARFAKAVAVLDLLESVKNLDYIDEERVVIWGHSNGGQIVISVLEISGEKIPTVLWAPVTKGFPEGVLVYADDLDDGGVAVRSAVSGFERQYDSRLYSIDWYLSGIRSPLMILQGDKDEWVELFWQEDFVDRLEILEKDVELVVYEGAGHNMEGSWAGAVKKTIGFFDSQL